MKDTLMTESELNARYSKELALDLSIEKYHRARMPWNWEELKDDPDRYLLSTTCGLCERYHPNCGRCAVKSCGTLSVWMRIYSSVKNDNRKEFLLATDELLTRMYEAKVVKPEKEQPKYVTATGYAILHKNKDGDIVCSNALHDSEGDAEYYAPRGSEVVEVTIKSKKFKDE